jgi:hypothetical protein
MDNNRSAISILYWPRDHMNTPILSIFDITAFAFNFIIMILSIYTAWINLHRIHISKYGFDALILLIGRLFDSKQVEIIRRDPRLIKRMGIIMLLFSVGGIYSNLSTFIERILPFIR